jgi:hypothetical protein
VKISTGILIRLDFISFALSENAAGRVKERSADDAQERKSTRGWWADEKLFALIQHGSWHCALALIDALFEREVLDILLN